MKEVEYQPYHDYIIPCPFHAGKATHPSVLEPQHLIHLVATGVYPSMSVTDIRAQGNAIGISKKSLWSLFSLNR
jgi:hypothetical protein